MLDNFQFLHILLLLEMNIMSICLYIILYYILLLIISNNNKICDSLLLLIMIEVSSLTDIIRNFIIKAFLINKERLQFEILLM